MFFPSHVWFMESLLNFVAPLDADACTCFFSDNTVDIFLFYELLYLPGSLINKDGQKTLSCR
jgi:hypothetical protein